jgi:hypothetical protein
MKSAQAARPRTLNADNTNMIFFIRDPCCSAPDTLRMANNQN